MKSITKLSIITASIAVVAGSAAYADNQPMQTLLELQRARDMQARQTTTTVAVYTGSRGVGSDAMANTATEARFELRSNAHGQTFVAYAPVR